MIEQIGSHQAEAIGVRKQEEWIGQENPQVSVLVAAWNEAETIESMIHSFRRLEYISKELIICAGGTDNTYELAKRLASDEIAVLEQKSGEGKQSALQKCLRASGGSIIYLTDSDCEFTRDAFDKLLKPLFMKEEEVVTGISVPKKSHRKHPLVKYQWRNDLAWAENLPKYVDGVLGRNCAIRRETLEKIGGFEAEVQTGTDYHLSRRLVKAGIAIRAIPESQMLTEYPDSVRDYLRMWRRWNKNLLIHGIKFNAWSDVCGVLAGFVIACSFYLLPVLGLFFGAKALIPSGIMLSLAVFKRYIRANRGAKEAGEAVGWDELVRLPIFTLLDFAAVFLAVPDAVLPGLRQQW